MGGRTAYLTAGCGSARVPHGSCSVRCCLAAVVHALGDGEPGQGKAPLWDLLAGLLALGFWVAAFIFRACGQPAALECLSLWGVFFAM